MTGRIMEKLMNCEAFLFDKDGTLIDFNYLWLKWSVAAARYISEKTATLEDEDILAQWGVEASREFIDSEGPMAVGSLDDIIVSAAGLVYRHNGLWPEARQLVVDAVDHCYETISKERFTRAIKGIPEMIRLLGEAGKKLAVVTTDDTESACRDMEIIGLEKYFTVVLGCDRVKRCKPFPDLVLEACKIMNVSPEKTVVIGDTRADMLMGRAAGVFCTVAVASGVGDKNKLAANADIVLESAAEIAVR